MPWIFLVKNHGFYQEIASFNLFMPAIFSYQINLTSKMAQITKKYQNYCLGSIAVIG
jgi:hypothetical protein